MKRNAPWYVGPYALLIICIVCVGFFAWRIITREQTTTATNTNTQLASCGNGVCENVACLSTNCPKPETAENCAQDCTTSDAGTGSTDLAPVNSTASNVNAPADAAAVRYTVDTQTAEQAELCPKEDMNLSVAEALVVAQRAGLAQGIKDVTASLYHYGTPLNQCVWGFRNFLTATSGANIVVIDSTQEVYERTTWGS